jgi:hypothetical protein
LHSLYCQAKNLKAQDSTISILKKKAGRTIPKAIPDTIQKHWINGGMFNLNVGKAL